MDTRSNGEPERADTELVRRCSRVVSLADTGALAALDADLETWARADTAPEQARLRSYGALWAGMRALMQGRFAECERRAREATAEEGLTGEEGAELDAAILLVHLRREQGRLGEAEAMLRDLLARCPSLATARVAWASLLGDLGRDSAARTEVAGLVQELEGEERAAARLSAVCRLAGLCALVESPAAALLYDWLTPHTGRLAIEPTGAACYGSVSHYLGLLGHALGRWHEAADHFERALEDHLYAGAPVLAAHTRRRYAALLRARGGDDDWDRATRLLTEAMDIYSRLGIDGSAEEAQAVLARSLDPPTLPLSGNNLWRRDGEGWILGYGERRVRLSDATGLVDLAWLLANPERSFHVADLWLGTGGGRGEPAAVSGRRGERRRAPLSIPSDALSLDERTRAECEARVEELARQLGQAGGALDPLARAVARAERDLILTELAADAGEESDTVARLRRLVTLRIRLALQQVDGAHPELGAHLRVSVRTGTFCTYVPPFPLSWTT